jgi:thiamine biosynthesis lipoprotein
VIARFATSAMATRFELVLEGGDEVRLGAIAEEVFDEVRECEARWSVFDRASVVSRLNREGPGASLRVDGATFELLEEALAIWRESGGWFDPALGSLMGRWGFRGDAARARQPSTDVGESTDEPGWVPYGLDPVGRTVHSLRVGSALDLGAIAKGRALDLAAEVLRDQGVERALLHGGTSSVVALGAPEGADGWSVALDDTPQAPRALLRDAALGVSSNTGRRNTSGGHILDPRSEAPTTGESVVCVVAPRASSADAWATALCAAGEVELSLPEELFALARPQSPPDHAPDSWRPLTVRTDPFLFAGVSGTLTS